MRNRNLHQHLECMLGYNILIFHSANSTDHSDSEICPVPPQNTKRQANVTKGMITVREGMPHERKAFGRPVQVYCSQTGQVTGTAPEK